VRGVERISRKKLDTKEDCSPSGLSRPELAEVSHISSSHAPPHSCVSSLLRPIRAMNQRSMARRLHFQPGNAAVLKPRMFHSTPRYRGRTERSYASMFISGHQVPGVGQSLFV